MHPVSDPPRGFEQWLESVRQQHIGDGFDAGLAGWLRVMAGAGSSTVALVTGTGAVAYVSWLQDGMSMSSRLILHTGSARVLDAVRPHFATDIRLALHHQDLAEFLSDIEKHRFDFIVVDLDDTAAAVVPILVERLTEHGLLAAIGTKARRDDLIQNSRASFFFCSVGECTVLSRKSLQHRAVRRGGRRRHTQVN